MRAAGVWLWLAASALAQGKPDFSGIFLRTGASVGATSVPTPGRIVEVRQTPDEMVVTASENGETAVAHFRFHANKSEPFEARLKSGRLVVRGPYRPRAPGWPVLGNPTGILEKTWTLSPDRQRLTICTTPGRGDPNCEVYTRQPSLEAAQAEANKSLKRCLQAPPLSSLGNEKVWKYEGGEVIGTAIFAQLTRCIFYGVSISGDFFNGLERVREGDRVKFRRGGQTISSYSGDMVINVEPTAWGCPDELANWDRTSPSGPESVQQLRFAVRWLGAEIKDLGEVSSELTQEPMREWSPPAVSYRMQVRASNIPLSDELEVVVFSNSGEELACVQGHL